MTEPKRLYRDSARAVVGGVCAGLAEYLNVDVTVVRVVTLLIVIFTGLVPGVLAYLVMWAIIPPNPTPQPPAAVQATPPQG